VLAETSGHTGRRSGGRLCLSACGLHRLHAYEVYSTSRNCCCRVAQLQPELELTSGAAWGRALRLLSDGGKTLSCRLAAEGLTARTPQPSADERVRQARIAVRKSLQPTTVVEEDTGQDRWSRWCWADRP
jgi:hypothetical protein